MKPKKGLILVRVATPCAGDGEERKQSLEAYYFKNWKFLMAMDILVRKILFYSKTLNRQPPTVNRQLSTVNSQLSTVNSQPTP